MEEMPIMTEPITTTSDRLLVLALDRQIEVIGYVLDYLIPGGVGIDVPVAADRECEGQEKRGDLRIGAHRAVRGDRVRPRQLRDRLGYVGERGPRNEAGVAVTDFFLRPWTPCAREPR